MTITTAHVRATIAADVPLDYLPALFDAVRNATPVAGRFTIDVAGHVPDAPDDDCHDDGCGYPEPHRHGFACEDLCSCKDLDA